MKKIWILFLLCAGCARAPLEDPLKAFRLSAIPPATLADSYGVGSLQDALDKNLKALAAGVNVPPAYIFDGRVISREEYRRALEAVKPELASLDRFRDFVRANFDFYEVYGADDGWGKVFSTGYYDPVMMGSRKRTEKFSRPIYSMPADLVSIDMEAYTKRFPLNLAHVHEPRRLTWRGRYVPERKMVVPYFSRAEIDEALKGRKLELAWLEPVDAFFLEIQGSGLIEFAPGDSMRVGYSQQNGYGYEAIGKYLTHVIPLEQMSMQRIRRYLHEQPMIEQDRIMNLNPSYVFFQPLKGLSLTFSGAEVSAARTIATDSRLFPKGTLGFLEIDMPVFADAHSLDPAGFEPKPRFVFDQDTGGAIQGGGRVDLYMGQGPEAERAAGVMKQRGKLWILAPKAEFLARLKP